MDNCTKAGLKSKGLFPIAKKKKAIFLLAWVFITTLKKNNFVVNQLNITEYLSTIN